MGYFSHRQKPRTGKTRPLEWGPPSRWGLMAQLTAVCFVLMSAACPHSARTNDEAKWVPVELPERPPEEETEAQRERRLSAQRAHLQAMRNKFQAAFVQEEERKCTEDAQCKLTPAHCCTCTAGGAQDAVSTEKFPDVVSRRVEVCPEIMCPQVISQDPSCAAKSARCEQGVCVPDVDASAPEEPAFGLGVESIPQ